MVYMRGNLYLTAMGRITLDDHNGESYNDTDIVIMTKEELTRGIKEMELIRRLFKARGVSK